MGASQPKQYLPLLGRPLIHHALATLCAAPDIDEVFVVLSVDDAEWARHDWAALGPKLVPLFCGGAFRRCCSFADIDTPADTSMRLGRL